MLSAMFMFSSVVARCRIARNFVICQYSTVSGKAKKRKRNLTERKRRDKAKRAPGERIIFDQKFPEGSAKRKALGERAFRYLASRVAKKQK